MQGANICNQRKKAPNIAPITLSKNKLFHLNIPDYVKRISTDFKTKKEYFILSRNLIKKSRSYNKIAIPLRS